MPSVLDQAFRGELLRSHPNTAKKVSLVLQIALRYNAR